MNYLYPDVRLIIFSKPPLPGQCKSRLIPALGEQGAAELQAELIHRCLQECCQAHLCPTEYWCASDKNHAFCQNLQENYPVTLRQQEGRDLGDRMFHALSSPSLQTYSIIIGTDCPQMSRDYLCKAIEALKAGADIVIGPAEDGGYVLLGLREADENLFKNIQWGGEDVFKMTCGHIQQLNLSSSVLETLWDVDRPEDYLRYKKIHA